MAEPARGLCKVLCFHPDHSLTLARMTRAEIRPVVDAWTREYQELGGMDWIEYVQIFENRGAMMGASNPHPHGQIWSTGFVPDEPAAETKAQREHLARTGRCLLCDYLAAEQAGRRARSSLRMSTSRRWFRGGPSGPSRCCWFRAAIWARCRSLTSDERDGLADALKRLTTRFDNLFETSFPYTMGFHQSPTDGDGTRSGISMRTSIRRCCARPRCASSWWALRCWACRSGILRRRTRPSGCGTARRSISGREFDSGYRMEQPVW